VPFEWLVPQPDPVNALLGWVVSSLGDVLLAGATRAILGTPAERALRDAFNTAIDAAADEVTENPANRRKLRAALRGSRKELARPENFPDLPGLVDAWLRGIDDDPATPGRLGALGVDRPRLASALCAGISKEVITDGLRNGPLQPLATHANFRRAFGLTREVLEQLQPIREMLEEMLRRQRLQAEQDRRSDPAEGARTLIEDRAATFTGREYVIDRINAITGDPSFPSGYLLVTGEPGIGKTSLLSYLITRENYPYHLNDRRQGITSTRAFLHSVCGQLARKYGEKIPSAPDSSTLSELLRTASRNATPQAPVVIAIDALDESEPSSGGANRLLLPQVLPPHVYFLITSRPLADYELSVDRRQVIGMRDDDPLNLQDIRSYINRELTGPFASAFAQRIGAWGVSEQEFTETLTGKSQGNFMYIVHMLSSVRRGTLTQEALEDIEQLPTGLQDYYEYHWKVMQERWPPALWKKHESAVRCLALMKSPVSPAMLVDLAGDENLPGVDVTLARAIFTEWREFLHRQWYKLYDEYRYFIYHDTFREFLEKTDTLKPLELRLNRHQMRLLRQILDDDELPP
jgi:AAA ATPase domain